MYGWKRAHQTSWEGKGWTGYRKPHFSGILMFLFFVFLFSGGFKWFIIPALFLLPMLFWGGWCDDNTSQYPEKTKAKNDEKRKRDDDPFYNDVEII
jgi:hypothetical protein